MTRERMADTRRALKSKGRRVAGRVPYGYTTDARSKQLIIVPTEASHIRAMFDLAGCGKTAREISDLANRKGWHTRPSPKWPHGGAWTPRWRVLAPKSPKCCGGQHGVISPRAPPRLARSGNELRCVQPANRADEAKSGLHRDSLCAHTDREAGNADGDEKLLSGGMPSRGPSRQPTKNPPTRRIPRARSEAIRVREGGRRLPR